MGDYGTQFGKMIEGYKRWHEEYDFIEPIDDLTKIYVRINELCKEDEEVLEICRDNFKKLEQGEEYETSLWEKMKELSLKEFYKVYDLLDVKFDSLNGEAFYTDKMQEVIDKLEDTGKLVESQGAKIIDLSDKGMSPCIICKSNGSSIYATRDLAAILYRARTYDFDKCLYVVAYEQNLHFKQIFEVAKLLGLDEKYTNGLEHVSYGMVHLKSGKMSTREGNVIKVEDLLNESIERASKILEEKNPNIENKEDIAKKVGIGAIIFNDLANSRIKDEIFDWDQILNFQGETGPYMQYIFVRTKSVLENAGFKVSSEEIDELELLDNEAISVIKAIYEFEETLISVTEKNEPYLLSRYLIDLAKKYSTFYNEHKILVAEGKTAKARTFLTYMVNIILENGAKILGIKMPDKM
ncbi:MAG: arginine--tRNA ligase [Clostridia bacterium]|nr:arginine--tRNA ligase [Clostridia bacterium]MCI9275375.1 arginine--tRNA ligase [Clostridia bacterium]